MAGLAVGMPMMAEAPDLASTLRGMAKLMARESDEPDDIRGLRARAVAQAADEIERLRSRPPFRCCLLTGDPGPWKAGVDDTADPDMVDAMHGIRDSLSYRTPLLDLIKMLHRAVNIDNRTLLGQDIQRCLLSNAEHRLTLLTRNIDPAPWRTARDRLRDAWAVFRGRAVAIHVTGSVYDDWKSRP